MSLFLTEFRGFSGYVRARDWQAAEAQLLPGEVLLGEHWLTLSGPDMTDVKANEVAQGLADSYGEES